MLSCVVRWCVHCLECNSRPAGPLCSVLHPLETCINPPPNPQKCPPVDRCVRYLGAIAALSPPTDAATAFIEALMTKLASHLEAADRAVRFRAAQALACVLQALPPGACVDEELAQLLAEGLQDRLRDKAADVRLCAARALGRLPAADAEGGYSGDPATAALVERLGFEKSKDVRAAVLQVGAACGWRW